MHDSFRGSGSVENLKKDELRAWRLWLASMQRATSASLHRRLEGAEIYWKSAFDIAWLRLCCKENNIFTVTHMIEPMKFLMDLLLIQSKNAVAFILFLEVKNFFVSRSVDEERSMEKQMHLMALKLEKSLVENLGDCALGMAYRLNVEMYSRNISIWDREVTSEAKKFDSELFGYLAMSSLANKKTQSVEVHAWQYWGVG